MLSFDQSQQSKLYKESEKDKVKRHLTALPAVA